MRDTITFVGDSYTNGAGTDTGVDYRFPTIVAKHFNARPQILGFNGSGYVARGPKSYNVTFPEAAERVDSNAHVIVILGSRNDAPHEKSVYSAALRTYSILKMRAPGATLVVVGPPWINSKPNPQILRVRDAVKTASQRAGVIFVDPIDDGWFARDEADGKSRMIATDHIHPNDAGQAHIAKQIVPVISQFMCESATK